MFFAALSNVRSLFNVGSIFRTADALGLDGLILGGYTGYPPRKEITKTALGAQDWIYWERAYNLPKKLRQLKEQGFSIIGLENNIVGAISLMEYIPQFPLVLVLGNEVRGLSPRVLEEIDTLIAIPMVGRKESLNVAVAFGIAAYHMQRAATIQKQGGGRL